MKPRISYAEFNASRTLDFDAMEIGKTPLLLNGEEVIYEGHHFDSLVWLRRKNKVLSYYQHEVAGKLKLNSGAM